jgi:hypothetical protein
MSLNTVPNADKTIGVLRICFYVQGEGTLPSCSNLFPIRLYGWRKCSRWDYLQKVYSPQKRGC